MTAIEAGFWALLVMAVFLTVSLAVYAWEERAGVTRKGKDE